MLKLDSNLMHHALIIEGATIKSTEERTESNANYNKTVCDEHCAMINVKVTPNARFYFTLPSQTFLETNRFTPEVSKQTLLLQYRHSNYEI